MLLTLPGRASPEGSEGSSPANDAVGSGGTSDSPSSGAGAARKGVADTGDGGSAAGLGHARKITTEATTASSTAAP